MTQTNIRAALEKALAAMSPALSTAYENKTFSPVVGTAYQKAATLFAEPDNPEIGSGYQERGIFQVTLMYPKGEGAGAATARAALLRATFARGSTFTYGGTTVIIERTPEVGAGFNDGDRWAVPVRCRFYANVF